MAAHESEWQTRKQRIDKRLRALGWAILPHKPGMDLAGTSAATIEEYPTENGPADYALAVAATVTN